MLLLSFGLIVLLFACANCSTEGGTTEHPSSSPPPATDRNGDKPSPVHPVLKKFTNARDAVKKHVEAAHKVVVPAVNKYFDKYLLPNAKKVGETATRGFRNFRRKFLRPTVNNVVERSHSLGERLASMKKWESSDDEETEKQKDKGGEKEDEEKKKMNGKNDKKEERMKENEHAKRHGEKKEHHAEKEGKEVKKHEEKEEKEEKKHEAKKEHHAEKDGKPKNEVGLGEEKKHETKNEFEEEKVHKEKREHEEKKEQEERKEEEKKECEENREQEHDNHEAKKESKSDEINSIEEKLNVRTLTENGMRKPEELNDEMEIYKEQEEAELRRKKGKMISNEQLLHAHRIKEFEEDDDWEMIGSPYKNDLKNGKAWHYSLDMDEYGNDEDDEKEEEDEDDDDDSSSAIKSSEQAEPSSEQK